MLEDPLVALADLQDAVAEGLRPAVAEGLCPEGNDGSLIDDLLAEPAADASLPRAGVTALPSGRVLAGRVAARRRR